MKKSKWPPARTAVLLALVQEGLSRREICLRLQTGINAVTTKLFLMGVIVPLNQPEPPAVQRLPRSLRQAAAQRAHMARFPPYEDITRAEAEAVRAGTPRSAPFRIESYAFTRFSAHGNAGALCAP